MDRPRPRKSWQTGTVDKPPLRGHPPITSRRTEFFVAVDWVKDAKEDLEVTQLGSEVGAKWWYEKEVMLSMGSPLDSQIGPNQLR